MDAGATVGDIGFLTAFFAVMAWLALSVELGYPPKITKNTKKTSNTALQSTAKPSASIDSGEKTRIDEPAELSTSDLEKTVISQSAGMADGLARSQLRDSQTGSSLDDLRFTFVDGYSCPRLKYDVALTVLYEYQNAKVEPQDGGTTMATEAFTRATQSVLFEEEPGK